MINKKSLLMVAGLLLMSVGSGLAMTQGAEDWLRSLDYKGLMDEHTRQKRMLKSTSPQMRGLNNSIKHAVKQIKKSRVEKNKQFWRQRKQKSVDELKSFLKEANETTNFITGLFKKVPKDSSYKPEEVKDRSSAAYIRNLSLGYTIDRSKPTPSRKKQKSSRKKACKEGDTKTESFRSRKGHTYSKDYICKNGRWKKKT